MIERASSIMILITILLTGCGGGAASPPLVHLVTDGGLVDGFQSSYCWDNGVRGTLCVDSIEPTFEHSNPLPANAPIRLQLDTPLPDSLTLSLSREVFGDTLVTESMPVMGNPSWSPAVNPGGYILTVHVKWEQGDVAYWFSILLE